MQPQPRGTRTIPKNTKATTWRHTGSCAHALLSATAPKSIAAKKKKIWGKREKEKSQESRGVHGRVSHAVTAQWMGVVRTEWGAPGSHMTDSACESGTTAVLPGAVPRANGKK